MNWYYKLVAQRPHLILIAVLVFSIACIVISLTIKKIPNFSDPTLVSSPEKKNFFVFSLRKF